MRNPADVLQATFDSFTTKLTARSDFVLPRRQVIVTGEPAYDCEEFIVVGLDIYQGMPGQRVVGYQQASGGIAQHSMDIAVIVLRAVPDASPPQVPNAAALTASALKIGADAHAITETFWAAMSDNSIAGACDHVVLSGTSWITSQGGLGGSILSMSVQL